MQLFTKQVLMSAKITFVLLLAASLQITARGLAQKVSLEMDHVPLKTVMDSISKQTGYLFFYQLDQLKQSQPVTIHARDADMKEVLALIFAHQPFTYSIANQTIVLTAKAPDGSVNTIPRVLQLNIRGRVTNDKGEPIAGASILIKGTNTGTITDENGNFILENAEPNSTLRITAIGYAPQEITLHGNTSLQIMLETAINKLDETQVIAYGTTTQRLTTGNITMVKAEDIEKQPVTNPLLALQGRVPGLFITQGTGLPGSAVKVQIQGQNSIRNGNDPLYIIDGVPYTSQLISSFNDGIMSGPLNGGPSPLNFINPSDIESISVLKDADATAIYGSRAANGAILITTKKGKAGAMKVDLDMQTGFGQVTRKLKMLNTAQALETRHEALANYNITSDISDYDLNGTWDTTRYADWQKELIGGKAQYNNISMTLSGGSENIQYYVGGTWHRETTVFPGNSADVKGSLSFSLGSQSRNKKFKFQLSGNYQADHNLLPQIDLTNYAVKLSPYTPALLNTDGSLNWAPTSSGSSSLSYNPMSYLYNTGNRYVSNLISNGVLSYDILPGLQIRSSFGYTNMEEKETTIQPLVAVAPEYRATTLRGAQYGDNNSHSWVIEPQLTYHLKIGMGQLNILAGATVQQNNSKGLIVSAGGFSSDLELENASAAPNISIFSMSSVIYKYNAGFGRINYNWSNKYIMDISARRDGSSRFGPASRFHNFGAVGVGWIFSNERFIKDHNSFLSFGKLSFSYGTTGNDQIGDYTYLSLYSSVYSNLPYQGVSGLSPNALFNPYLEWELTKKLYSALNLGFLKDRILLNVGYQRNRSSNQLLNFPLPAITGFRGITTNLPATVQNTSWEVTLNTINIQSSKFTWKSSFNLTIPRNKLISYPGLATSGSDMEIGKSIGIFKSYKALGVDPQTGIYQFLGSDGKPTNNPSFATDRTVIINLDPKFYGGLDNSISFKGFDMGIFLQFVKQLGKNAYTSFIPGYSYSSANVPYDIFIDHWQKPGDHAIYQKFYSSHSGGEVRTARIAEGGSSAAYTDASFVRVKNVSLSWQIPTAYLKTIHLQSCRVFIQAENLFTITRYKGMDPENQSTSSLPPLRVLTFGLHIGL